MKGFRKSVLGWLDLNECTQLQRSTIELENVSELKKLFSWDQDPILEDDLLNQFDNVLDLNGRRILDAEALAAVVQNASPSVCLDIGTAEGHSAALMARNAPQAKIYTINIPPEEILSGEGGVFTTIAMEREKIGAYYLSKGINNITQIIANTAHWKPDIGRIDVAYIDGSHDTEFVYNDTKKVLANSKSGSFILWHDFAPALWNKYAWIYDVCKGIEMLLEQDYIQGNIFHVRNSWVGIYRVP